MVTFELFGAPRLRAGAARLELDAATLGAALDGLRLALPALDGPVVRGGRLLPSYKLSLNADRFVSDPETPLADGDRLLLLAADVGG